MYIKSLAFSLLCVGLLASAPSLAYTQATVPSNQNGQNARVIIRYTSAETVNVDEIRQLGGTVSRAFKIIPAVAATLPLTAIDALVERNPNIVAIEEDAVVQATQHGTAANDAEMEAVWGVEHIGAAAAHAAGAKGTGVKVAVFDTGIDYTNPDIDGNYAGGYDFVQNDADPKDDNGHGTHTAGTIGAEDNGSGVVGVAPEVQLYAVKVLDYNGSGLWSSIIAGLEWSVDNGMQVTNSSLAGGSYNSSVHAAYDAAAAAGMVHVASAGNSGTCDGAGDTTGYPARFESVIAVAATDASNARACFSSTGASVEFAAPGVSIYSTYLGGYATMNGTSMSAPHVAGVAALVVGRGIQNVRGQLQGTATDLGPVGRDTYFGYGLVNAALAVGDVVSPPNTPPVISIASPLSGTIVGTGLPVNFVGSATDSESGTLTSLITWDSSIDGELGTGSGFSRVLTDGDHTITAIVVDPHGATSTASVSISVRELAGMSLLVTSNKSLYTNRDTATVTVTATSNAVLLSGAQIQITVRTPKGNVLSQSAVTNAAGVAQFKLKLTKGFYGTGIVTVDASGSKNGYTVGAGSLNFQIK